MDKAKDKNEAEEKTSPQYSEESATASGSASITAPVVSSPEEEYDMESDNVSPLHKEIIITSAEVTTITHTADSDRDIESEEKSPLLEKKTIITQGSSTTVEGGKKFTSAPGRRGNANDEENINSAPEVSLEDTEMDTNTSDSRMDSPFCTPQETTTTVATITTTTTTTDQCITVESSSPSPLNTFLRKVVKSFKRLSVEPAAMLLMTTVICNFMLLQELTLERVCRVNLNYSEEICDEMKISNRNHTDVEEQIQIVMADVKMYRSMIDHLLPIIFVTIMGPWSDIYGSKIPMLISCLGFVLQTTALLICSYFENMDAYSVSIISAIPKSICGAEIAFLMFANSYICSTATDKTRTTRLTVLLACFKLGTPLGFALGGLLFTRTSLAFIWLFIVPGAITFVTILIIVFTVKNKVIVTTPVHVREGTLDVAQIVTSNRCTRLDPKKNVVDLFRCTFRPREDDKRSKLMTLLIMSIFISAPTHGEFGVMYLFTRYQLDWNTTYYTIFSSINSVTSVFGPPLLIYSMRDCKECLAGFTGSLGQLVSSVIYGLTTHTVFMYVGCGFDSISSAMNIIVTSMIAKVVQPQECGKIFSLLAIIESIIPLIMEPAYAKIYQESFTHMAGLVFLISAVATLPLVLIFGRWLLWEIIYTNEFCWNPRPAEEHEMASVADTLDGTPAEQSASS